MSSVEYKPAATDTVHISASVAQKIIKHASEHYPTPVSGPLLGLDNEKTVNVTHCLPYPTYGESNEGSSFSHRGNQKYVSDFVDQLRLGGFATQFTGWYQATLSGNFCTHQVIDSLLHAQLENPEVVLVVHDVSKMKSGVISLRAYRLSEKFFEAYTQNGNSNKFVRKQLVQTGLNFKNFLVEVPIMIQNSHLISLYMSGLKNKSLEDRKLDDLDVNNLNSFNDSDEESVSDFNTFDCLKLGTDANEAGLLINKLTDSIDDHGHDLQNFNYFQRQYTREFTKVQQWKQKTKAENAVRVKNNQPEIDLENGWKSLFKLPAEPSRYESMLTSSSINTLCDDLELGSVSELVKGFTLKSGLNY